MKVNTKIEEMHKKVPRNYIGAWLNNLNSISYLAQWTLEITRPRNIPIR